MCGFDLATLYTVQHGLARHAQCSGRLLHSNEVLAGRLGEARFERFGQADPPRRPRGHLLTCYQAVIEPAMQRRWRDVQHGRVCRDGHDFSFCCLQLWLEAWDAPMVTQMRDPVGFEAMATSGRSPLSIENAGDDS